MSYFNFLKQFRNKSLNKRTYCFFVAVLLQNLELFKRNICNMLHNCCGSLLVCFKFFSLFKDRCLPSMSTCWGILCRDIFHSLEFVVINSRLCILLLFFPTMHFPLPFEACVDWWCMQLLGVCSVLKELAWFICAKENYWWRQMIFLSCSSTVCTPFMRSVLRSSWTLTLPKV